MEQEGCKKLSHVKFQLWWATDTCHDTELWAATHLRQSCVGCFLDSDWFPVPSVFLYQPWPQRQNTVPGNFIYRHSKLFFFSFSGWTELYSSYHRAGFVPWWQTIDMQINGSWVNMIKNYRHKYCLHAVRASSITQRQLKNQRNRISLKQPPLITEYSITRFPLACEFYIPSMEKIHESWQIILQTNSNLTYSIKNPKMLTVQVTELHTTLFFIYIFMCKNTSQSGQEKKNQTMSWLQKKIKKPQNKQK